jgi:CubicO group peptidase (beta-lactamase class C family)
MEIPLQNHPFWDEISAHITSQMAAQQIPGLSLTVLKSGKLLFAQGYGLGNLELGVQADEQTVYGLASISKTFAATALMLLVAEGQCSLDDSVRVYFPRHLPVGITSPCATYSVIPLVSHFRSGLSIMIMVPVKSSSTAWM